MPDVGRNIATKPVKLAPRIDPMGKKANYTMDAKKNVPMAFFINLTAAHLRVYDSDMYQQLRYSYV